MRRKVSEKLKKEMLESYINGMSINQLSEKFDFSKITITRHLKKIIDERNLKIQVEEKNNKNEFKAKSNNFSTKETSFMEKSKVSLEEETSNSDELFFEIAPLNLEIDNAPQKDLSSIPISEVDLPKVVYMIVNNKIELETKLLGDYADWQFLPHNDLKRTSIEIFFDIKIAKRFCNKEQKVIKVPNSNLFKLVSPLLASRGISRIVSPDKLIAI